MRNKYTVNYFIKKFSAIPRRLWTTGKYTRGEAHCVLGHCGVRSDLLSLSITSESDAFSKLILDNIVGRNATGINDWSSVQFPQRTPRGRILAALKYIKLHE